MMSSIQRPDLSNASANMLDQGPDPRVHARSLIQLLKERSKETATLGRLPDNTIADLNAGALLSMTTPRRYGGGQVSVRTFLDVVTELGRADASVA